MAMPQNVIAVIFDFDDTLTDDSTTALLRHHGIDADEFWSTKAMGLIEKEWDPTLAYLTLMLDHAGEGHPLGLLSNKHLREFGSTLEFYIGLPGLFDELKAITQEFKISNPRVEFYIISGGLEEVIRGSSIAPHVDGIYGCRFAEDENGVISKVKNVISFTEKTRFIFEIHKGIGADGRETRSRPYAVNEAVAAKDRRIPLRNMIYVGDGLTDVPCFSLIQNNDGQGFGVFDPTRDGSPKKAWQNILAPKRVISLNAPKYRETDELGAILRAAVSAKCQNLEIASKMALG